LLGSGGYAFCQTNIERTIRKINKASLGVTQIFLGNVVRLNEHRFTKYYCNKETNIRSPAKYITKIQMKD
jgi:hypothetical protein